MLAGRIVYALRKSCHLKSADSNDQLAKNDATMLLRARCILYASMHSLRKVNPRTPGYGQPASTAQENKKQKLPGRHRRAERNTEQAFLPACEPKISAMRQTRAGSVKMAPTPGPTDPDDDEPGRACVCRCVCV